MLSYTFVAHEHLRGVAFNFVLSKTKDHASRAADFTEVALQSPLTKKLISESQFEAIQEELRIYRSNPEEYVGDLVTLNSAISLKPDSKIEEFKQKIRVHYNATLSGLILDLRIFNFSNFLFGTGSLIVLLKRNGIHQRAAIGITLLVAVATVFGASMYVDDMSFFSILFKKYLGWGYPIMVLSTIVYYFLKHTELILGSEDGRKEQS